MILSYRDLDVWKKAMKLARQAYLFSGSFPKEETYGLTSQIRRSASSIPANIAEGRARGGRKEFIHFLTIATGSLAELETHLLLARDLEYCPAEGPDAVLATCVEVGKMLNAMIRSLSNPPKADLMILTMLKSKIHRAHVTGTDISYEGSITIDPVLIEAAGMLPYEQVDVLNINNGARFTTYIINGKKRGNGDMIINGAAARLVQKGDLVIVCTYASMTEEEAKKVDPIVVSVDEKNQIRKA